MERQIVNVFLATLVFSGASHIMAQEPAPYLRIIQEDIKSGKSAAHQKSEMAFVRAFSKSKFPHYSAWETIAGPSQAWFVERYNNYAAIEDASRITNSEPLNTTLGQLDEVDGALRTSERTIIAHYLKDLSYLPAPLNIAKNRFVLVSTIRIRPGRGAEFTELRKLRIAALEKAGTKMLGLVYAVGFGAPAGTYLVISGVESMKAFDDVKGADFGSTLERYQKLSQDIIISSEDTLFAVNPKMSYPTQSFIDSDPDFWAPKPKQVTK
jgi:hypothetical protein